MTDAELKIMVTLVGIASAVVGAITSGILFFWLDGRKRYQSRISGLRTLLIVIEAVFVNVRANALQRADLKLDWFIAHADALLRNDSTFSLVRRLIQQVAEVQVMAARPHADIAPIIGALDQLRREAELVLVGNMRSARRFLFLTAGG